MLHQASQNSPTIPTHCQVPYDPYGKDSKTKLEGKASPAELAGGAAESKSDGGGGGQG